MGSAQAGLYSGLGQGISNAGQAVMQALYMAQAQKLQQQQLGIQQQGVSQTGTQQQFQRDTEAANFYQQTGQDRAGYSQGLPIGVGGQSATSGGAGTGGATPPPLPATATAPVPTPGNLTQSQAAPPPRSPLGVGGGAGVSPVLQALQAAQAGPGAGAGVSPGIGATGGVPSFMPSADQLAQLPPAMRREAVMNALQAGQAAQLKGGVAPAVNPQELDIQNRTLAETTRANQAKEANERKNIEIMGGIRSAMMGLTQDRTGASMAGDFAKQTADDRKAGLAAQQLDDAFGQAMGTTTPDGKPNPTALKSLIVNQIASTEPGMQVRLGTLKFNGTGGDMSAAGQIMSKISVAIGGLPLQQQMQAMHGLAQQMITTKASRYADEYAAEATAHPEIPQYEKRYLDPTMSPQRVFGHYAPQPLNPAILSQAKAAIAAGKDPDAARAHYTQLTNRNYDADSGAGTAASPATAASTSQP